MKAGRTITAVICVYNEERTVGGVVKTVLDCDTIDEAIVVNDGSTDNTAQILGQFLGDDKFRYVEFNENMGKSYAMTKGVELAKGDVILFIDADIIGFESKHIEQLVLPLIHGEADMVIGQPYPNEMRRRLNPLRPLELLAGERALYKKDILPIVDRIRTSKYGVETLMVLYYKSQGKRIKIEYLWGVTHLLKFQKEEPLSVLKNYLKEASDILGTTASNYSLVLAAAKTALVNAMKKDVLRSN